jgi:malic enzyme
VSHGNSTFIFPGVALGALVADAWCISDAMLVVAAQALSDSVPRADVDQGVLYPRLSRLRTITLRMALEVAREAIASGIAAEVDDDTLQARLDDVWRPTYVELRRG